MGESSKVCLVDILFGGLMGFDYVVGLKVLGLLNHVGLWVSYRMHVWYIYTYIYHKHQSNVGKYTYYTWILWVWFFWHIFRIGILLGDVLIGPMPSDDRCWGCSMNKDGRPTSTSTTSMCGGWIWQVPKEIPINLLQCNIFFQKNVSPLSWYYRCSVQKCGGVSNDISDSFDMNFILLMLQKSSTTCDRKGWCNSPW